MIKVIASVTNDLSTDQRLHKVCTTLTSNGYEVVLVGRLLPGSKELTRSYRTMRMRLSFNHGPMFYAAYNIRLFFFLLFTKTDILVANDLDTLLANYLVSKIKGIPLIYDTHEYYCGMPELVNRPLVRSIWKGIETTIFPRLKYILTVNESVAELYRKEYNKEIHVVKNYPMASDVKPAKSRQELDLPEGPKIIIYQGAVNVGRGLEEAIKAMSWVDNAVLLIIGDGNDLEHIRNVVELEKSTRVIIRGSVPFEELWEFTAHASLGLAIEKDDNLNYKYSLSNKVFDYIHAEIPILSSRLIENERLFSEWEVATYIDSHEPLHIAEKINFALSAEAPLDLWSENLKKAKKNLTWDQQSESLLKIYKDAMPSQVM